MTQCSTAALPLEVELVSCVKQCRTCSWFWEGTRPYGPYPGFDFCEEFPEEVRQAVPQGTPAPGPRPWLTGKMVGSGFVEPGVLHGCRKAPIMTIGINPNLTAWSASAVSAPWIYPAFESEARYAYYYRYFTLYQQTLAPDFVRQRLDGDTLRAADDGYVRAVTREFAHNYLKLVLRYQGRSVDTIHEIVWKPEHRWVVLKNKGSEHDNRTWFKKDELIAGCLRVPDQESAQIYSAEVGYYRRMVPILKRFQEMAGLQKFELTVGEDVSQHDMVACASPGWQSKYDMPMDMIALHCVMEQGWLVSQVLQSQPKVAILVGLSAAAMFQSVFAPYMQLDTTNRDVYQLLQETCSRPTYLDIALGSVKFRTRLIVAPHFSYDDGFLPGARLSSEAWKAFAGDFPADAKLLDAAGRVSTPDQTRTEPVVLIQPRPGDPLSARAREVLAGYFLDPAEMIAKALAAEPDLKGDLESRHLARAAGPCNFCDNRKWTFPGGCSYQNAREAPLPDGQLREVSKLICQAARERALEVMSKSGGP
jgi:hypothetical protein